MLQQKRSVQFLSIEILEFAYTVGDNPSVVNGVPLSSEWTPQRKTILPLCVFEKHRPPHSRECGPRRICSRRREKILLRNGCSIQDMSAAATDVLRTQKERAFTQYQLQTRKLLHSRRKRDILHQEPAEVAAAPSSCPRISIIRREISIADRSPMLPQRRSSQGNSSTTTTTINYPSSTPTTVSPRAADEEKLTHRLSPTTLMRQPRLTVMIARTA
jgi:hypothetical protein